MGYPALQKIQDGIPVVHELLYVQLGGDELSEELRRDRAGVVHKRYGVTIGSRTWVESKVWRLNINACPQSEIETLQQYFELGEFYF